MPALRFGGAERVTSVLANEWVKQGVNVRILLVESDETSCYPLADNVELKSCRRETQIGQVKQGAIIRAIRKEAKEWKPDAVICFYNALCGLTAIALRGTRIPLIYSERNDPNRTNQRKIDKVYKEIVEHCAAKFVFQTTGAQKCYPKKVQDRSAVILNPLDTTGFPTHDFTSEKKEIVTVGRLEPQKNQKILIDAFSKFAKDFPDYKLTIYGEGSLRPELEQFIQSKGLQDRVMLPGSKNRIQEHIKDAALFVLSSDYEGIPNALIEAMAIGLPCVSTDCSPGGARELINDGENGVIVDCGNSDARHDVTISAVPEGGRERQEYSMPSIDHEAEQAIDAQEAEFGADGIRVFQETEAAAPTIRELHEKYKPIVLAAVMEDVPYRNACGHSDRENAVIEGNAAIRRAILGSSDLELIRLYSDVLVFRQRLHREIIDETYPRLHEMLRPLSQDDIDDAIRAWNGDIQSKHAVVRYMEKHGREKDTAAWLAQEYSGSDSKSLFVIRAGSPEGIELPWPKVQRRIAQLIKEDRFYTEAEQDRFDNIDPIAIREALAERGIVNGELVDEEKLDNDPFIQRVMADVEQIAAEEQEQSNQPLSDAEYARHNLIPGETTFVCIGWAHFPGQQAGAGCWPGGTSRCDLCKCGGIPHLPGGTDFSNPSAFGAGTRAAHACHRARKNSE
jgi:glycosyltransferase involved in cell wall biosynthesis